MKAVATTVLLAVLLTACAPKPIVRTVPLRCPPVPVCTRAELPLTTNGELAAAYLQRDSELKTCAIARDTLQACLDEQP